MVASIFLRGEIMYEILLVYLWTVACRYRDDGDCMVYSLFDLLICTDDIFPAWFGGFGNFIVFGSFWWISANFAWLDELNSLEDGRSMFLKLDFHWRFSWWFCWISCESVEFNAWIHLFASQETSSAESFQGDNKSHYLHVPSLLVVKRVASTFVEVSLCFGVLCFLADANTAVRTCVSTGSWRVVGFSHLVRHRGNVQRSFEVMGMNVDNIRPCNRQDTVLYRVLSSLVGQVQGDLALTSY